MEECEMVLSASLFNSTKNCLVFIPVKVEVIVLNRISFKVHKFVFPVNPFPQCCLFDNYCVG